MKTVQELLELIPCIILELQFEEALKLSQEMLMLMTLEPVSGKPKRSNFMTSPYETNKSMQSKIVPRKSTITCLKICMHTNILILSDTEQKLLNRNLPLCPLFLCRRKEHQAAFSFSSELTYVYVIQNLGWQLPKKQGPFSTADILKYI